MHLRCFLKLLFSDIVTDNISFYMGTISESYVTSELVVNGIGKVVELHRYNFYYMMRMG